MKNILIIWFFLIVITNSICVNVFGQCIPLPLGATKNNPINVGLLLSGSSFVDTKYNDNCYGNEIGNTGNDIFYQFTVSDASEISVSTCGSAFDTAIHLLDSQGETLYYNDDYGPICANLEASMKVDLPAGTYYVVVEGGSDEPSLNTGNIKLQISVGAPLGSTLSRPIYAGILEDNISFISIRNNNPSNNFGNNIGQPSDDIYYKFIMNRSGIVSISNCGSGFDTYLHLLDQSGAQIVDNNDNGPLCLGNEASIKIALAAGVYYVASEGNGSLSGNIKTEIKMNLLPGYSTDQNHIITRMPLVEIKEEGILNNLESDKDKVRTDVKYFDGLGKLSQTVQLRGSPGGTDLIQPVLYDTLGRESQKYLLYASFDNGAGNFRSKAITSNKGYSGSQQYQFYTQLSGSQGVVTTAYPFSKSVVEASSLGRVLEESAPGDSWQISGTVGAVNAGHTVKIDYKVNSASGGNYPARNFVAEASSVLGKGYERIIVTDGFYNSGELNVKIVKDENWISGKSGTTEEYKDKQGHVVLRRIWENENTPLSTYYVYDELDNLSFVIPPGADPDNGMVDQIKLDTWCYQYRYDGGKRLIEKRIPGKSGWEYMVYNKLDQLVLSQDPKQRIENKWLFTKYDALGRTVYSGAYVNNVSRTALQDLVNLHNPLWETRNDQLISGYSNLVFPTDNVSFLMISYYDDYSWPGAISLAKTSIDVGRANSLLTGRKVYTTDGISGYLSANYYNADGRLIDVVSQNHLSGINTVLNSYTFTGELSSVNLSHQSNSQVTTIKSDYKYDHMGRRLQVKQSINGAQPIILSQLSYNSVGQLKLKQLHSTNDGASFLNTTDYSYNAKGWLKKQINPLFNMELYYDDHNNPSVKQYNGNISGQAWGSAASPAQHNYTYSYDRINRLTSGISDEGFNETLTYNVMSNITSLTRSPMGTNTYTYNSGNQLSSVAGDFVNTSYTYDENGNQLTDGSKGININYNYLNLPITITKPSTSEQMTNTWLSNGLKLKKVVGSLIRDYSNGIEYNNGVIEFIQTEEGRAIPSGNRYSYEYVLKDHLGNTRVLFKDDGSILETPDYYPFGLQVTRTGQTVTSPENRYKYNGKELQSELGLMQYDYGARFYDPVIGRWNVVDPLAEQMRRYSPYTFVYNNPLRFVDPDGMKGDDWVKYESGGNSYAKWDDNVTDQASAEKLYGKSAQYEGKTGTARTPSGYKVNLNSDKTWSYDLPQLDAGPAGPSLSEAVRANMPTLNLAEGIATGTAIVASGSLGAAESGTSYLLGQAARKSEFMAGLANYSFSTGRNVAATLTEQLSMAEITSNPTLGTVLRSVGPMKDTRWFGWSKLQYSHEALDGSKTTIHYVGKFVGDVLKAVDDFKFK